MLFASYLESPHFYTYPEERYLSFDNGTLRISYHVLTRSSWHESRYCDVYPFGNHLFFYRFQCCDVDPSGPHFSYVASLLSVVCFYSIPLSLQEFQRCDACRKNCFSRQFSLYSFSGETQMKIQNPKPRHHHQSSYSHLEHGNSI